ncbi:MAG: hypothetical protein JNM69_22535 [Archangium sp.]|nr:hypothetical protein [Archangium sp.]
MPVVIVVVSLAALLPYGWLTGLASLFLVARVAHGAAYVAWWCGFACVLGLFGVAFASALGTLQA